MARTVLSLGVGLFVLALTTATVHAEDRAILIGAGKYASGKWGLELVDENIRLMEEAFINEVGIAKDKVVRITDEAVTRTGVIRALRQAARAAKRGDRLFVYYTGHATKVIVQGAPLRAYFTWDTLESDRGEGFDRETLFTDIDLKNWIEPLKAKGVVVIVFREACFSGGGYGRDISALSPGKPPVREPVGDLEISACDVDEAAWALESAERPVALFTHYLAKTLSSERQKISARSLFDTVRGRVSGARRGQTPILDCVKGIDPRSLLLVDRTLFDLIVTVTDAVTGDPLAGVDIKIDSIGTGAARAAKTPEARFDDLPRQARVFPWIEKAGYLPKSHAVEVPRRDRAVRTTVALEPEVAEVEGRIAVAGSARLSGMTATYESGARPLNARHVDRETAVSDDGSFSLRVPPRAPCRITVVRGADTLASVLVDEGKDLEPVRHYDPDEKRWAGRRYDVGAIDIDPYLLGIVPEPDPAPDRRDPLPDTRTRERTDTIGILKEWRIESHTPGSPGKSEMREILSRLVEGGRVLYKTERKGRTELIEDGKITLVSMEEWTIEDEKERIVEMFRTMPDLDGKKTLFHLVAKGNGATLVSRSGTDARKKQVEWDRATLGPVGILSLRKETGFEPGTSYSYMVYVLPLEMAVEERVEVMGREMIQTADGRMVNAHLLAIHQSVGFGIDRKEWCDEKGETIKTSMDYLLGETIEIFRTAVTPAEAGEQGAASGNIAGKEEFWREEESKPVADETGKGKIKLSDDGEIFWNEAYPGFAYTRDEMFKYGRQFKKVTIYVHKATGLEFVRVPGGVITMGAPEGMFGRSDSDGVVRRVKIKPFLLCRTECTQAAWDRIGGYDIRQWKGADLPIERVSWDDCTVWCRKAGLRLPTEAEWEYACRAGTSTAYHSGKSESDLDAIAWYLKNSDRRTHPVGEKTPNAFGLRDMSGNVWEWCQDTWHESYAKTPGDGSACVDGNETKRVARGACFESEAPYCRSATRNAFRQDLHDSSTGFRPAFTLP